MATVAQVGRRLGRRPRLRHVRSRRWLSDDPRFPPLEERIPVTILTGFLGAGKTTLLNRILKGNHGLRLAVIQNEFGEVGVDHLLTAEHVSADKTIFQMNNGCLCCTVRSDLAPLVERLYTAQSTSGKLDGIVVETTGLALPGPVLTTFLRDYPSILTRMDAVITLVDARNIGRHLAKPRGDSALANHRAMALETSEGPAPGECAEQIAFADVLLLNKCDLVSEEQLVEVEARLRAINSQARLLRCTHSDVPLDELLDLRAFELHRILDNDAQHDGDHAGHGHAHGDHAHGQAHAHVHAVRGQHDAAVASVAMRHSGTVDPVRLESWLGGLLEKHSADIYRVKGVLALRGPDGKPDLKFACQGVHDMFHSDILGKYADDEPRDSRLVFIGRNLDAPSLRISFAACLEQPLDE